MQTPELESNASSHLECDASSHLEYDASSHLECDATSHLECDASSHSHSIKRRDHRKFFDGKLLRAAKASLKGEKTRIKKGRSMTKTNHEELDDEVLQRETDELLEKTADEEREYIKSLTKDCWYCGGPCKDYSCWVSANLAL